jgi:hypothetical protein
MAGKDNRLLLLESQLFSSHFGPGSILDSNYCFVPYRMYRLATNMQIMDAYDLASNRVFSSNYI